MRQIEFNFLDVIAIVKQVVHLWIVFRSLIFEKMKKKIDFLKPFDENTPLKKPKAIFVKCDLDEAVVYKVYYNLCLLNHFN